jgi:two-component system, NtrC family, response regulator HydG
LSQLARRARSELRLIEQEWLERCRSCAELDDEDPTYGAALGRVSRPLFDALSLERAELAEIHALELFQELNALGFAIGATLRLIDALHAVLAERDTLRECRSGNDELRHFLTQVAVGAATTPAHARPFIESEERTLRPLPSVSEQTLVGACERTSQLRRELMDVADAPGAALIVGESGTGKELVAQALHRLASRRERPFLAINCAALPRELIESELFGHERGAFTGSRDAAPGLLRAAAEGTVFLDEITEMPQGLQPKLLRALEQRAVRPVGGVKELPIHARIVAATNRDPEEVVRTGQLRADLFYRLCVHRIDVPPLRERASDIPELIRHFLRAAAERGHIVPRGLTSEAMALLLAHDFPGNVRELRNVVEHCCATAKGIDVQVRHLPQYLRHPQQLGSGTFRRAAATAETESALATAQLVSLKELERRHILRALEATAGNKASAARLLGISRHQLYVRLERLGLLPVDE